MIKILITDTHYGIKQNSITWLNSQCDFIEKQLIPYIKNLHQEVQLIHLGDVFDSRSTISTLVASRIVKLFSSLRDVVSEFIIIDGNHDYYSPNSDEVDTLSLILGNLDINIINRNILIKGSDMFVPWYQWDPIKIQKRINKGNIKNIFTHADIVTEGCPITGCNIYSGHIHIPYINDHIRNLGSCYALNFGDSNSERGFYKLDNDSLEFIPNKYSIKFYRIYNDEIFENREFNNNDYIEIYIDDNKMSISKYNDKLSYYTKKYKNIRIIPNKTDIGDIDCESLGNYDLTTIIKSLIPKDLKDKFKIIEDRAEY